MPRPAPRPAGRPLSGRIRRTDRRRRRATGCDATDPSLRLPQGIATAQDLELIRPVRRPRLLGVRGIERPLFAVGRRLDAAGVDAVAHEILLGGSRPTVAEGEVVLVGAALVAMTRDP